MAFSAAPNGFDLSLQRFQMTIEEINKFIDHIQKAKEAPLGTDRNLPLANGNSQDARIKRLTRGNPTMAGKFVEVKKGEDPEGGEFLYSVLGRTHSQYILSQKSTLA